MLAGLTKNQATVYLTIVKNPEQRAGQISKTTKIDRSFVYGILDSLLDKGLVSYVVKENSRNYSATDPENLMKDIDEKKEIVADVIGEIGLLSHENNIKRSVNVYEGKAGLKVMTRSVLESRDFCVLGGGAGLLTFETLKYEIPHYLKEIKKNKIRARLLVSGKKIPLFEKLFLNSNIQIKVLKKSQTKASFLIFDDKMAIYSLHDKPIVIIIEDKNIANALHAYFDLLWVIAN